MRRSSICGCVMALVSVLAAGTQVLTQEIFMSGQNVQPAFEGWQRNADGTLSLFFGYLNRNYQEQPHIPVGPNNSFQPGPADRGQPTHFYPRRQQFVFEVMVPADFGDQEVIWTLTHHGRTSTAVGSLLPVWEIDAGVWAANRGFGGGSSPNKPPSASVVGGATFTVTLPEELSLTALASDDGRPGPRQWPGGAAGTIGPSALPVPVSSGISRTKKSGPMEQDMVAAKLAYETGLAITWLHYRGPGQVTFDPMHSSITPSGDVLSGKSTTTALFTDPGAHVIRAVADDGTLTNGTNVTVVVQAAAALGHDD